MLYNVENVLIWVLIGLSWVLTLVAVVGYKIGVLYVLEYMVNVGVIWVGIQVSSKYELYFQPLVNLKYIFGYNASVAL